MRQTNPTPSLALDDVLPPVANGVHCSDHRTVGAGTLADAWRRIAGRREVPVGAVWAGALLLALDRIAAGVTLNVLPRAPGESVDAPVASVLARPGVACGAWLRELGDAYGASGVVIADEHGSPLFGCRPEGVGGASDARFWLTLPVAPNEAPRATFDPARMHADTAASLCAAVAGLASALAEDTDRDVSDAVAACLDVPAASDAGQSVAATPTDTVVSVFDAAARAHPDRIALEWADGAASYADLASASRVVAVRLRRAGVAPGAVVAVCVERGFESISAILGILRAGAAYLPIDPALPLERTAGMLTDSGAVVAIASPGAADRLGQGVALVAPVDVQAARVTTADADDVSAEPLDGDALAYVMFTSGSTGVPKGVAIRHRSILRLVSGATFMRLDASVAMLHAAPLGFDASTLEIWGPLLNGGRCVLHAEAVPTGPGLAASIARHGVNAAWLTAALFNAIVDDDPRYLSGLAQLLAGGEALSVPHVARASVALPDTTLINGYGPTECTTFTTTHRIERPFDASARSVPIGRPIQGTWVRILNARGRVVPDGVIGELHVGGPGLSSGYLGRDDLTAERFVEDPSGTGAGRVYRTGDLVWRRGDGAIEFVGRRDGQVKIRGFRIETGEVEAALAACAGVRSCAVVARNDGPRGTELVAYVVPDARGASPRALREALAGRLPAFMVPAHFVELAALPVTANGKLDRRALPPPTIAAAVEPGHGGGDELLREVAAALARTLGVAQVGPRDNFFELGGNSLLATRALASLRAAGHASLHVADFFAEPTPEGLVRAIRGDRKEDARRSSATVARGSAANEPIAVIGMAGRFPGARDVEAFWRNLCEGRETIRFFAPDELDASLPTSLTSDPSYVRARGVVDDVEMFDSAFFGINPSEADLMDPQQRLFLEVCWEAFEHAGQAIDRFGAPVGVFGGMYNATYFQRHVSAHPERVAKVGEFQVMLANEKDYVATRVANRLNLTGPAVSVHTACSTSLVAIAQAVTSLRAGQCRMAVAGGASITCPPASGYLYQEGAMLSPDGHTRSFDADAQGTVFSDGVAVVVLKRLSDALADRDTVYAVIRGVAVNNDGGVKASFTAPSVEGQSAVVRAAIADAGVDPRDVSYVEAHGTATPLGDPVEVEALTRAFGRDRGDAGPCGLGSVKSNIGHLVIAAGATGLIKTALALHREHLPATLHFRHGNPKIDWATTPFRVVDGPTAWPRAARRRIAGVSSFGVGGTNAHVVLEEGPPAPEPARQDGPWLLRVSARTPHALGEAAALLATRLADDDDLAMQDVAWTLDAGRTAFSHRLGVVADDRMEAASALTDAASRWRAAGSVGRQAPSVAFAFPGQGAQYARMGAGLYARHATFRDTVDRCAAAMADVLGYDLRDRLFDEAEDALLPTSVTQPATFCVGVALAALWRERGLVPDALIGHSIGEFAAATVAGVMALEDAARLVARRGALMQDLPEGTMLSVRTSVDALAGLLPDDVDLAADNAPGACVLAGQAHRIESLRATLESRGLLVRVLRTSHAFHSRMMDAAVGPFEAEVRRVRLSRPTVPIASTVTGSWMTDAEATDPGYWARHLRQPVRFSPAVKTLLQGGDRVFVELGPRGTLSALVRQHAAADGRRPIAIESMPDAPDAEVRTLALSAAKLWTIGIDADEPREHRAARRIALPTYPFEKRRHWVDAPRATPPSPTETTTDPHTTMTAAQRPDRRVELSRRLRDLLEEVSGTDLSNAGGSTPFVELGLDSLTLTQAAIQVKRTFAVNVTFRQLMERYRTLDALVEHLAAELPAEAAAPGVSAPTVAAPAPLPASAASAAALVVAAPSRVAVPARIADPRSTSSAGVVAPSDALQDLIREQVALMSRQLELLAGSAQSPAQPSLPVVVAPATEAASPATATEAVPAATAPAPVQSSPAPSDAAVAARDGDEAPQRTYDVRKAFGAIARIHTSGGTDLSTRQRARLDAFIARYAAKTAASKGYTATHRPHLADPRVVNGFRPLLKEITYQIVMQRSQGAHMWDLDGNEYVDALNGFGMSLFGWQPQFVVDAIRRQLDDGYDIGPQHPLAGPVAKLVCELTGFDRAALCNTGSEAVMGALRIARTVTGRSLIVIFSGAYHGIFDEVIVRGTRKLRAVPAAPGIMPNVGENVLVLEYGTPEAMRVIRERADELAAVLVEPVQSRRPDFQPREFLKELRDVTERSGTLLIFDEVVTGFRSHRGGIQALFGIRADLASYGKVVGGGFPIGVIAGRRDFMDALDGGAWSFGDDSVPTVGVTYFAGTFVRHPLALAAAHAVLLHLKERGPELQATLNRLTASLCDRLNRFCTEVGAPIVIKHFASVWKVFFTEDHPLQDLLFAMMRNRGVHILDNFPCFLTTAHGEAEIAFIEKAFRESVAEMQVSEFLPGRAPAEAVLDASRPPVEGARLGRDASGKPAWFVPNPDVPGKYLKVE